MLYLLIAFYFSLWGVLFVYRLSSDISLLSYLISVQASSLFLNLSSFHIYFVCVSIFLHQVIIILQSRLFLLYPIWTLRTSCACFPKKYARMYVRM